MRMPVTVVNVRVVRMLVGEHNVPMRMHVWLLTVPWKPVRVLVMLIVSVAVNMLQRFMCVLMLVSLLDVQPNSKHHQHNCHPEQNRWGLGP